MNKLALAAMATAALGAAAASPAYARVTGNGPQLTGHRAAFRRGQPTGCHHGDLALRRNLRPAPS